MDELIEALERFVNNKIFLSQSFDLSIQNRARELDEGLTENLKTNLRAFIVEIVRDENARHASQNSDADESS